GAARPALSKAQPVGGGTSTGRHARSPNPPWCSSAIVRRPAPSAAITYRLHGRTPSSPPKTRELPSGANAKPTTVDEATCDSWVAPVPSAFMTHSSVEPLRQDRNAILVPSGDHCGRKSAAPLVSLVTSDPSAFITKR